MDIKFYNSLTKKKEIFTPHQPNCVSMYVCGVTPYDYPHLGHGRVYINFDILFRLLTFLGHSVTYVRNFTDIDDKILARAEKEGTPNDYSTVAQRFIDLFHQSMHTLNCLPPTHEPRVTQYIPQIIDFIADLVANENAYVIGHDVYFDITSFSGYGKLSGRGEEDLMAGARVEIDTRKRSPGDFVLWKGNKEQTDNEQKFWNSPWGYGRPGWHIECSVMIKTLLGQTIDIHGGGADLVFPHHENEITQSESLHGHPLAHFWLHNAFITINKEKMSKSLGNFITLHKLFEHYDPMVFRYFILQHHYRTPIDFADAELLASQTAYKKIVALLGEQIPPGKEQPVLLMKKFPLIKDLLSALCDDLKTPKFLGLVFENLATIKEEGELARAVKQIFTNVLGLTLQPLKEKKCEITPEIQTLIEQREQARLDKNWALSDQLRSKLQELGYTVEDKKSNK